METMATTPNDGLQKISQFWTPLPECQQQMLSGGAPRFNGGVRGSSQR
jgi:hypothetical protein